MREGNKRMIIESFFFHLPRACLIKVESEVLVSTGDFRVVLTKSTVSLKRSIKVTVDLRGVFWGKQYSALCINKTYINLYIIGELISLATRLC